MKAVANILIVEDHRDIAEMIVDYFEAMGFTVDHAHDGVTGLHLAVTQTFDLIILDLSLPGIDGVELCKQLRQVAKNMTPVLMLTARDSLQNKLDGFDVGADDYLVKPFEIAELEARARALLRRQIGESTGLQVGDLSFDPTQLSATRQGEEIRLTPITAKILEVLMRASPRLISKPELERQVYGDDLPDSDSLRSHIYALRKAVDKPFNSTLIKNAHGGGYRLNDS